VGKFQDFLESDEKTFLLVRKAGKEGGMEGGGPSEGRREGFHEA
jgi:hypothetical protein